jgi:hypothetical protein
MGTASFFLDKGKRYSGQREMAPEKKSCGYAPILGQLASWLLSLRKTVLMLPF